MRPHRLSQGRKKKKSSALWIERKVWRTPSLDAPLKQPQKVSWSIQGRKSSNFWINDSLFSWHSRCQSIRFSKKQLPAAGLLKYISIFWWAENRGSSEQKSLTKEYFYMHVPAFHHDLFRPSSLGVFVFPCLFIPSETLKKELYLCEFGMKQLKERTHPGGQCQG